MNLISILPDFSEANKNGYFRYSGSLTTPPCTEGIIWTVFRQTVPISESQVIEKQLYFYLSLKIIFQFFFQN